MLNKATEVIINNNSIIYKAIYDNDPRSKELVLVKDNWRSFLKDCPKIDLLIICEELGSSVPWYKINTIINLTLGSIAKSEIQLSKPYKLYELIKIITRIRADRNYIFCAINNHWLYNQREAVLSSSDTKIKFTDKENLLFSVLLSSKNYMIDREKLLTEVWRYHQNSESTTVDTHLYNLKQKLPTDLMLIKDKNCLLNIDSID